MDIENIAITGLSGRFPKTKNVEELKEALINGIDLITDNHDRWPYESMGTPRSMGIVNDLDHFDASFFEINPKSAELHDPRGRKLLEVVYESIVDAGVNPCDLKGTNTGVFVAMMQNSLDYDYLKIGSGINSSSYIISNNISYTFDFRGPSCTIDTGCSSSIYAINQAIDSIRLGSCEAAVVCGAQVNLFPYDSVEFTKLGVLNPEGRCKTFDDDRKGYVKSEAVVAIFLQKKQNAIRIYATISGVACGVDGYKEDGLIHPSCERQMSLMKDIYQRYNINPNDVVYIDCHGTGTLVGDIEECQALADFFATTERNTPLHIGSVKTNLGHTEAAAGLVSLVKILVAIQSKIIPANLHFKTPAIDIPPLTDGKLKVVSSNTEYNGGLMALNSFGLGGANGHMVIKPYSKCKSIETENKMCRLIQVSGRTEEAVENLLNKIKDNKDDIGFLSLIDNIFSSEIKNHNYRGYTILNSTTQSVSKCSLKKRPIWFTYSGMGSQWPEMGKGLMNFEVFRNTIKRCANAVTQYGLDLEDIILNGTTTTYDDPINCFTSIIAVSVALTDLLFSLGIKPDGIIGHSLGEIGCAYGDGLITAEQATLTAYGRGWATKHTKLIPGLMASVGLSIEECEKLLPEDIYIACDNSINNVTISGPEESVKLFVEDLRYKGIFVRCVNTANIAFHSKYVREVGPKFHDFLKNILSEPKRRKLWLPSAVPNKQWDSDLGKYNSAKYQVHNFLNKVLYNQVLQRVPKDAILLEIAPCGLFQAIFRRATYTSITKLYLVNKFHDNNEEFLLDSVGKFYLAGGQPNLKNFYIKPKYPVGPETSMISPLIKWNHTCEWSVPKYNPNKYFGRKVEIDVNSKENKFLLGHIIGGRNIFPASGYIVMVWQAFAKMLGTHFEKMPVVIEKMKFLKYPPLSKTNPIVFIVNILKSGTFEISEQEKGVVATGRILLPRNVEDEFSHHATYTKKKIQTSITLNSDDVYKILKLRGYDYESSFRGIVEIDCNGKSAKIKWNKNWESFLNYIFQAATLTETSTLVAPSEISKIVINPAMVIQHLKNCKETVLNYNPFQKSSFCDGLEIKNINWLKNPYKRKHEIANMLKCQFIPNIRTHLSEYVQFEEILRIALQIIIENNLTSSSLTIAEILNRNLNGTSFKNIMHSKYLKHLDYNVISNISYVTNSKYDLIIARCLENNEETLNYLANIDEGTFVLSEISINEPEIPFEKFDFITVFKRATSKNSFILFKKAKQEEKIYTVIKVTNDDFDFTENIEKAIANNTTRILLVDQNNKTDIIDFHRYVRKEYLSQVKIFCIKDKDAEIFSLDSTFYQQQLRKDISVNILKNNEWGTYRHLPIEETNTLKYVNSCCLARANNKFQWVQQNSYGLEKSKVNVYYSSLGFWDQHMINEQKDHKLRLGMEYSGINSSGIRVMGISPSGSLTTHLVPHRNLYWIVPREWTLKEAATVPFAYTMSYYGLFVKGNLQTHDTVLINFNAHSIELAAINFTLSTHCTVFVAVTSAKHVKYLASYFPKLKYNIINYSKKNIFESLMQRTNGQGIDTIFNFGKEDCLRYSTDALKYGGKVINVGFNSSLPSNVVDELLDKDCVIYNVTLENLLKENDYTLEDIRNSIQEYLRNGIIYPFSSKTIDMAEVNSLLEHFNKCSYQSEKIAVKIHPEKHALNGKNKKYFIANPRTYFHSEKCYILISELDDFDLEVIKWLSKKGARKFIISSTRRPTTGYQIVSLENLKKRGNTIIINCSDTTCTKGAEELINQAIGVDTVGGIFCFSMEFQDKPKHSISNEEYTAIYQKRIKSIKNIDIVSRTVCNNLDHFVVFLSQTFDLGHTAPSNYGYINASIENLCETRREANLPALAVEWGPITNIDSVSQLNDRSKSVNVSSQSISSCLETLDFLMRLDHTVVSSTVLNLEEEPGDVSKNVSITESVAKIFGIKNVEQIDFATPLINLGMDSIMGFEMKNLLHSHFNVDFSIHEIRRLTLENIKKLEDNVNVKS